MGDVTVKRVLKIMRISVFRVIVHFPNKKKQLDLQSTPAVIDMKYSTPVLDFSAWMAASRITVGGLVQEGRARSAQRVAFFYCIVARNELWSCASREGRSSQDLLFMCFAK